MADRLPSPIARLLRKLHTRIDGTTAGHSHRSLASTDAAVAGFVNPMQIMRELEINKPKSEIEEGKKPINGLNKSPDTTNRILCFQVIASELGGSMTRAIELREVSRPTDSSGNIRSSPTPSRGRG